MTAIRDFRSRSVREKRITCPLPSWELETAVEDPDLFGDPGHEAMILSCVVKFNHVARCACDS